MSAKPTYEELEDRLKLAEKEINVINTLYNAATIIGSNLSLEAVIKTIAEQITYALNSTGCTIELWHRDKNISEVLIDYSIVDPDGTAKPGTTFDLNEFPTTVQVLETEQPIQIQVDDPTADRAEVSTMQKMGVCSLLIVPMIVKTRALGFIEIFEEVKAREYTRDEIRLAESLAAQGAVAIESSLLYKNARNEIAKRKRAESAHQETKELFGSFMRHLPALAFMKDKNGRYIYLNQAYKTLYKIDPKARIGKTDDDLFPADLANQIIENDKSVIKKGKVLNSVERVEFNGITYHQKISKFPIFKDGQAIILAGIAFDITDQVNAEKDTERLEEKLQRSQRMEALGLLAGGVAHDLNNVLTGIVSYPDLLLLDLPEDSPLRDPITTIQKSGQRAAEIVQDLLALTRRGVVQAEVLNLNHIVSEYLKSPEHYKLISHHPSVSIKSEFDSDLLNIKGSSIHLKKSIMNLVSNAAEAQPKGGQINLSTQNRYIDCPMRGYDDFKEGDYVVIKIEDQGDGIAPDDLKRIFEPFYTKKVMGKSGTGLGMSVVWGTVQDHNGYINVESTEGKGTIFELYFPVTREGIIQVKQSIAIDEYMGHQESILVVDDVKEQRDIAAKILHRLGYSVKTVPSGEEAVKYLLNFAVDLVILDMIMAPGIDGLETYKQIIEVHPKQRAIIASGFAETERVHKAHELGARQYIKKPYTLEKIGLAVKIELKN